jgi:hypothetical protein
MTVYVDNVAKGTDNGAGGITGAGISGTGTINYATGAIDVTFTVAPPLGDYVSVADTITGNVKVGTSNTHAFLWTPNDLKVDRAVGADFFAVNYAEITTEGSHPANADVGAIALYPKSDGTDPVGAKKLYQVDSAGNEREFCYTDSLCNDFSFLPDTSIIGGMIGSPLNSVADNQTSVPFSNVGTTGRLFWPLPGSSWLTALVYCQSAAEPNGAMTRTNFQKLDPIGSAAIDSTSTTVMYPTRAQGCYGSTQLLLPLQFGDNIAANNQNTTAVISSLSVWSSFVIGARGQPLGAHHTTNVISPSTTGFSAPGQGQGFASSGNELTEATPIPFTGTISNLCVSTGSTQPGTGDLVVTLRLAQANTTTTVTIAASSLAGTYCDFTHTSAVLAGQILTVSLVNGASGNSAQVNYISMLLMPASNDIHGMVFFPRFASALSASATKYFPPFGVSTPLSDEKTAEAGTPYIHGMSLSNGACYVQTAPGSSNTVVTLFKNGIATAFTLTITTGGGTGSKSFSGGPISYDFLDTFSLEIATGSGSVPVLSSCTFEIDEP